MRRLHRWVSIAAAVLVLYVSVTGIMMAFDNVWGSVYMASHGMVLGSGRPSPGLVKLFANDGTVADATLSPMLQTTLAAAQKIQPDKAMPRVIRLRSYGGKAQGVVVTGGDIATQVVIDTSTGAPAELYEPGYPRTPMPFQWNAHETWKELHRGDFFGLTGRWLDLLAGLAILFLCISAMVMYLDLYKARSKAGRRAVFWK